MIEARSDGGGEGGAGSQRRKTKTPHGDVGKNKGFLNHTLNHTRIMPQTSQF